MEAPHAHNLLFLVVFRPGEVCPSCGWFKPPLIFPLHHLFSLSVFVPANVFSPARYQHQRGGSEWWSGINLPADAFACTCLRHVSILGVAQLTDANGSPPSPRPETSVPVPSTVTELAGDVHVRVRGLVGSAGPTWPLPRALCLLHCSRYCSQLRCR